jgi:hypothetical protein
MPGEKEAKSKEKAQWLIALVKDGIRVRILNFIIKISTNKSLVTGAQGAKNGEG